MKIKIITCHDVYNVGASLQAYALCEYLRRQGQDVEIIDYKPYYLRHYELVGVRNPKFDKPVFRVIYQILKFPGRLLSQFDKKKRTFDKFTEKYLPRTEKKYCSNDELKKYPPEADLYIAGSDQIWNPTFENGKDPAFFLDFVPDDKKRISYAASFAVEEISDSMKETMKAYLQKFYGISVRETSGVSIILQMGLAASHVLDPVFLLEHNVWEKLSHTFGSEKYLFLYDFDQNRELWEIADNIADERGLKILSAFPSDQADQLCDGMGPCEFLGIIRNADIVLSNSFHATAFSLIFHKDFYVVNRMESINARMRDLLDYFNLAERLISKSEDVFACNLIDWMMVDNKIQEGREQSKMYLRTFIDRT